MDLLMIIPVEGIVLAGAFAALIVMLYKALRTVFGGYEDKK